MSEKKITEINQTTWKAIEDKSAKNLPNKPTEHGWSANAIREALYLPITAEKESVLAELKRVISEANTAFQGEDEDIEKLFTDTQTNASDIDTLKQLVELLQIDNGQVGVRTVEGGEKFNDYENNRAGARAFSIVGAEREDFDTPTLEDINKAYSDDANYEMRYYQDFNKAVVSDAVSNSIPAPNYVAKSMKEYVHSEFTWVEDGNGGAALQWRSSSRNPYFDIYNSLMADRRGDAASGKSFIFSMDVKGGEVYAETPLVTFNAHSFFKERVQNKINASYCPIYIGSDGLYLGYDGAAMLNSTGKFYTYSAGVKIRDNKILTLSKDEFVNIAVAINIPNNTWSLYIDGIPYEEGLTFINPAHLGENNSNVKTDYYPNGFGLAYVRIHHNESDVYIGKDGITIDNIALYYAEKYAFVKSFTGTYKLDAVYGLEVGDMYSACLCYENGGYEQQVVNCGIIKDIDNINNSVSIEVRGYKLNSAISDSGKNIFYIASKPDVGTQNIGKYSHAINSGNFALGENSFAGGKGNIVEQQATQGAALGEGNVVRHKNELIVGEFAKLDKLLNEDSSRYLFKVGNGKKENGVIMRSDAFAVDNKGNAYAGEKKLATEEVVDAKVGAIVEELVDTSPTTLNTLKELSSALNNDEDFAATMLTKHSEMEGRIGKNEDSINELSDKEQEGNIWNKVYPVGSIYMSVNSTSPQSLFGGHWEQIEDTFLLAAGSKHSAGSTGGEEEHTLAPNEMPAHQHTTMSVGYPSTTPLGVEWGVNYDGKDGNFPYTTWQTGTAFAGGGQAHNNMPPYLAVYMWVRTE